MTSMNPSSHASVGITAGAPVPLALTLDEVARGIARLPSLPAVVVELLQSLGNDDVDTGQLARQIARDQALVAKMLRLANSSFYGLQGKINSISDAIVVLGLHGVRTLATAAAVTGAFGATVRQGFDFRVFWRHSIGIALCARALARHMRMSEENAFTAGLLHDIGRLVLASAYPQHLAAVLDYQKQNDCALIEAERAILGLDHAQIGQVLTERWKFPPLMCDVIARHHDPSGLDCPALACVIHVADAITHALDLAGDPNEMVPPICPSCWRAADLGAADLRAIFAEVEVQFEGACGVLLS